MDGTSGLITAFSLILYRVPHNLDQGERCVSACFVIIIRVSSKKLAYSVSRSLASDLNLKLYLIAYAQTIRISQPQNLERTELVKLGCWVRTRDVIDLVPKLDQPSLDVAGFFEAASSQWLQLQRPHLLLQPQSQVVVVAH